MSQSENSSRASTPDSAFHEEVSITTGITAQNTTNDEHAVRENQSGLEVQRSNLRYRRGHGESSIFESIFQETLQRGSNRLNLHLHPEDSLDSVFPNPGQRFPTYWDDHTGSNRLRLYLNRGSPLHRDFSHSRRRFQTHWDDRRKWQRIFEGRTYQTLLSKIGNKECHCFRQMFLGINQLKGFHRLDTLQTFLDTFLFKVPFKVLRKSLTKLGKDKYNWTYEDLDIIHSEIKGINGECKTLIHKLDSDSIYIESDFIPQIEIAATRKDAWYIISLLMYASSKTMQIIYKKFCTSTPDQDFCCRTIVDEIKRQFKKMYAEQIRILHLWTGYQSDSFAKKKNGIDTLVVITESPVPDSIKRVKHFRGLNLLFRMQNECNKEAEKLLAYEIDHSFIFGPSLPDEQGINSLFMKHSNLTLISASCVRSKGYKIKYERVSKTPTIALYCQIKGIIPVGERLFPRNIGDFMVDVREGTCDFAGRPLRISEKIGTENLRKTGTIGGFVNLQNPKRKALLTCAHVVLPTNILKEGNDQAYVKRQEVNAFDGASAKIGEVAKTVFNHGRSTETTVDAALIEITDRHPCDGCFADVYTSNQLLAAGFSSMNPPYFSNGQIETISEQNFRKPILKVGASSGLTLGSLKIGRSNAQIIQDLDVKVDNTFRIRVYNQLEVIPRIDPSQPSDTPQAFLTDGDSGAFVYSITNENPLVLKCIGMAIAKTSYGSCLLTPIDKIFDALDLPYDCLSTFNFPESPSIRDSDSLTNMLAIISQQLTEVKSTMAVSAQDTKNELGQMKNSLQNINDRLFVAESEIKTLKKANADNKDDKSNENET